MVSGFRGIVPFGLPLESYSMTDGTNLPSSSKVTKFRAALDSSPAAPETGALGAKALKNVVATNSSLPSGAT